MLNPSHCSPFAGMTCLVLVVASVIRLASLPAIVLAATCAVGTATAQPSQLIVIDTNMSTQNWLYEASVLIIGTCVGALLVILLQKCFWRGWMKMVYWGKRIYLFLFARTPGMGLIEMQSRVSRVDATGAWCFIVEAVGFINHETARYFVNEIVSIVREEKNEGLLIETLVSQVTGKAFLAAIRFDGLPNEEFGKKKQILLQNELAKRYGKGLFSREVGFSPPRKIP